MRAWTKTAALAAISGSTLAASGAILTWNLPGGGVLSNPASWNPAQAPTANDDLVFATAAVLPLTVDVGAIRNISVRSGDVRWPGSGAGINVALGSNLEVGQLSGNSGRMRALGIFSVGGSVIVGRDAGSTGTITLDAAFLSSSFLDLVSPTGDVIVGSRGTGTLEVGDGNVRVQDDVLVGMFAGSVGTLTVSGSAGSNIFGDFANGGDVIGTGPNSDLLVGNFGQGTLTVTQGGRIDMAGRLVIGQSVGSVGTATVAGQVSFGTATAISRVEAGQLDVGANSFAGAAAGAGSLTISSPATVLISGTTTVGDPDGGPVPTLRIQTGATLDTVDFVDRNNVTQYQGGRLRVRGDYLASAGTVFSIQGTGTVDLEGANARLDAAAPGAGIALRVGDTTPMTVESSAGAVISVPTGEIRLGNSVGGGGVIRLLGGGSLACNSLFVGFQGAGGLSVEAGGIGNVTNCFVGTGTGGSGAVTVLGAGALLDVPFLTLGSGVSGGTCSMVVGSGGEVHTDVVTAERPVSRLEVRIGGLLHTLSDLNVAGTLAVTGGTVRSPSVNLIGGASHQMAGRVEGVVRLSSPAVACVIGDLDIVATAGSPLVNVGTLDIQGELDIQALSNWNLGNSTLQPTGSIASNRTGSVSASSVFNAGGLLTAQLTNLGTISCFGTGFTVASTITSQTGTINGTQMELLPTGVLNAAGTVACKVVGQPGSTITALGTLSLGDGAAPSGVDHRGLLICGVNAVTLRSADTASVGITTMNAGTLECRNSAGTLRAIRLREELNGSGTVRASAVFNLDEGGQSVVRPHGLLTINGSYSQLTSGALLGGKLRGQVGSSSGFDRLAVTGTARLGGTLFYQRAPGYLPAGREEFIILTAGSISGEFDVLDLPLGWGVEYTPTTVVLVAVCPSDFNRDGSVDGDDVIGFFASWDAGESAADFNRDGSVDGDDVIGFFGEWDSGC
ncbi:MAG: GC-type dockerin domain-anchored protein [Phycisphaerales bacterium]